ncbi:WD repeat domain 44 [Rhinolophus ferrumequinum]|uniref:WD repeat domain 44 n=1 Tax=Rhinolophus ferrumequinum TaxID=59479 RepID=A0A7J8AXV3_RHIFE|nr:WD repeat domain 44 [Rhinolophus ferrumequinum]
MCLKRLLKVLLRRVRKYYGLKVTLWILEEKDTLIRLLLVLLWLEQILALYLDC